MKGDAADRYLRIKAGREEYQQDWAQDRRGCRLETGMFNTQGT